MIFISLPPFSDRVLGCCRPTRDRLDLAARGLGSDHSSHKLQFDCGALAVLPDLGLVADVLKRYLARVSDPPPGNTVMWRGLTRLTDIELGAKIGAEIVGN